jgi:1-acyl-sn-glycerol-3-phosphate acyltransferase
VLTAGVRTGYRFEVRGLEHVPRTGPAIVAANHVSFIDWLFVGAAIGHRTPRFVMHEEHFDLPWFRWFFDLHGVIAIAPKKVNAARRDAALEAIDAALANGDLVMLFPEGVMTPDGELGVLRPGITRIASRRPVPVVPVGLSGLYGSFFSCAGDTPPMKGKAPRPGRSPVTVSFGAPIPPAELTLERLAGALRRLRGPVR